MPFRSYLYLDDETVDDYLSEIEGGLLEGPYTAKDQASSGKEGGISAKIPGVDIGVSGKRDSSSSLEVQRTVRDTPQAKFRRLYEALTDDGVLEPDERLQVLNGFDQTVYDGIRVGEIVEVRGQARLPEWEHFTQWTRSHERFLFGEDGSPQEADLRGRLWHVASLEPLSHPRLQPHDEGIPGYASLRALSAIGRALHRPGAA